MNAQVSELDTKAFKISPKKENYIDLLTPLKSPASATASFSIMPLKESINSLGYNAINPSTSASANDPHNNFSTESAPSVGDYKRRVKEITDLKIVNEDLIKELEILQDEVNHKNRIIDIKSMKIDELMHENNRLLNNLKQERESNENDFNTWLDLKTNLELQIHNLKNSLEKHNNEHKNSILASYKDKSAFGGNGKHIDTNILTTGSASENNNSNTNSNDYDNDSVNNNGYDINNDHDNNDELYNQIQLFKNDINKLKKKVNALRKENELEVQSKIMIMDELEMMRERYLEVDEKHEFLKLDYDDLVKELLLLRGDTDDNNSITTNDVDSITPTQESSQEMKLENSSEEKKLDDRILSVRKKRITSKSSSNTSDENSRIASLRNNSLNKAIRDVELKSQKQKYSQELIKYEFEIKSLKLQNEKLLSYIGYTLQVNGIDVNNGLENLRNFSDSGSVVNGRVSSYESTTSNNTATYDNIEYSDAYNIRSAHRNLKTVMKSASALPIRPDSNIFTANSSNNTRVHPITVKKTHKNKFSNMRSIDFNTSMLNMSRNANNSSTNINDMNDNDSFLDFQGTSIDYSTDYNQGEVECIDIGGSDSFEEYGDDELEEEEDNLLSSFEGGKVSDCDDMVNKNRLCKNKQIFTSTDSLNVSYKMNLINPKTYKSGKSFKTTTRTQLKRLTPSSLNLNRKTSALNDVHEEFNEGQILNDDAEKVPIVIGDEGDDDLIINDLNIINGGDDDDYLDGVQSDIDFNLDGHKHASNAILSNSSRRTDPKYFSMYQISEEDESEDDNNYNMQFSSSDDNEDDGDEDETFNISNQEIDMFKIDFLRRLYCPKHSMFQCFCRSMDLVNPLYFKIFSSPIYSLRRKLKKQYQRKGPNLSLLKLKSKMLSNSSLSSLLPVSSNGNNGACMDASTGNISGSKRAHPMRYHRHEREIQQLHTSARADDLCCGMSASNVSLERLTAVSAGAAGCGNDDVLIVD
ncbi:hypothetical protein PMKS-000977 [Pichia membranifaciens]|uniref:Uncharacterized protein n=1 Tax=Pichia membranifaciens TaxID=4926 RepID=A0A1Q2YD93_9ASCO|nr:hypothetical protein PMKS-000977 [Pichia membranifaciens]